MASTEQQIDDAVAKRHIQNTDTALGAMSADLDVNLHRVIGLDDPVGDRDGAHKKYVDDSISGYTNLTEFVDQTAWRLFCSNSLGDVVELALGISGKYLKATGVNSAPIWDVPAGGGDVLGPATNSYDYVPQWDGVNSKTLKNGFAITAAGKNLLDDANVAAQRATLELLSASLRDAEDTMTDGDKLPDGAAIKVYGDANWSDGGYTNLTEFISQTAWRLFYSNGAGDIIELALGTNGQYLKATGVDSIPAWDIPGGAGDVLGPATHAANYVPQWSVTPNNKTLVEGFAITVAGKALIDDANVAAQRTTLELLSAALRNAEDTLTNGNNLPDGAAIKAYGDANWSSGSGRYFNATYVVYKSGSTYYAKANTATGLSDYSNAAFHTLLATVLSAISSQGGKIYFMPGVYSITSTITGRSNVIFEGSGNHFGQANTFFSLDADVDMFIFNAVASEFEFSHINFDGNDRNYKIFNFNGTNITTPIQDLAFTKCNFYHCRRAIYGLYTYDLHFTDVGFEECGYQNTHAAITAHTGCNFWHFKSCRWESLNGRSFYSSGAGGESNPNHSFSFVDCKFHGLDANRYTCIYGHLFYSRIVGCLFFNIASANRAIYNQDKGLVIDGNTFCCINGYAIELVSGANGCTITGNSFGGAFGDSTGGNPSWILNNASNTALVGNSLFNHTYPLYSGSGTVIIDDYWGTGGSSSFSDGGEAGGANRTLGNTDNYSLGFLTNNNTRLTIAADGHLSMASGLDIALQGTGQFKMAGGVYTLPYGGTDFHVMTPGSTVLSAQKYGFNRHCAWNFFATDIDNPDEMLIEMNVVQRSGAGQRAKTGMKINHYSQPDNGGDVSGLLVLETGGGSAITCYKTHMMRPTGFADYSSSTQGAFECGSGDDSQAGLFMSGINIGGAHTRASECIWCRIDNTVSKGILVTPGNGSFDTRQAFAVGNIYRNSISDGDLTFLVKLNGDVHARELALENNKCILFKNFGGSHRIGIRLNTSNDWDLGCDGNCVMIGCGCVQSDPILIRVNGQNNQQVKRSADTDSQGKHYLVLN